MTDHVNRVPGKKAPINTLFHIKHRFAHSDSVFPGPFTSCCLVSGTVGLVHMGNLGNEWVVRVWVSEHRADREKDYKRVRRRC